MSLVNLLPMSPFRTSGTERDVAVDAICVPDVSGQMITDKARLMPLKQELEKAVIGGRS